MRSTFSLRALFVAAFTVFSVFNSSFLVYGQQPEPKLNNESKQARDQSLRMLEEMEEILREHYYDPTFRKIDLKDRVEKAKARIKTLQYNWQMYRVLVQLLMDFNDSHTRLTLPSRTDYFQYGFTTQMIGDDCLVIAVKHDSDAYKQGVEVGDQIVTIGKFKPNRRDLWKVNYVLYKLDPVKTIDLKIRKPDGVEKALTVTAKTMTDKEYRAEQKARKEKQKEKVKYEPFKCKEVNKELIACKLYSFVVDKNDIDKMMKQASAYPKFILDLRGNGGGYVFIEEYLISHFFNRQIKIADMITKDKTEKIVTKPLGKEEYKGEVAVLVDSNSASAAEMTARVLQIEKRAKIYGDITSGSVMTSIWLPFRSLMSLLSSVAIIYAGMSVTVADVVMSDGSRLEDVGVLPDEVLQPTQIALVKRTDPVLAYAAFKFGATLSPEDAGKFYFMVPKEDEDIEDGDSTEASLR